MCKSPLHPFLEALPKVELHIHLEGSLSPGLLFELAAKNSISLPRDDPAFASPEALHQRYQRFTSLDDFLPYFYVGMTTLLHPSDFELLAYAYFKKASSQNVRHAEVFFDGQIHTSRGMSLLDVTNGFKRAQIRAKNDFGITSELIMCTVRHLPAASGLEQFQAADAAGLFNDGTIHGIGLDSTEVNLPATMFAPIYDIAKSRGVRRTIHAGEECPASYVDLALDVGATRIDHGWRSIEDEAVLERLVTSQTLLTICPISNVKLKGVSHVGRLPIREFIEKKIKFNINSDDPEYFGAYIQENYCAVQEAFDLTAEEWIQITKDGIEQSWASAERIQELLKMLGETVQSWT